jgi:anti-anti-sigma factor
MTMEPRLHISEHRLDGRVCLDLEGEFSLSSLQDFQDALIEARSSGPDTIDVDMRRLAFIDSQGIGAMLTAWRSFGSGNEGILFLIRRYSQPWRALRLTGLTAHLPIEERDN